MRKTQKRNAKRGTRKRKLTDWNLFVMKIKKENPKLSFKEVLVKASKERAKKK
jgi:hypothetical protein